MTYAPISFVLEVDNPQGFFTKGSADFITAGFVAPQDQASCDQSFTLSVATQQGSGFVPQSSVTQTGSFATCGTGRASRPARTSRASCSRARVRRLRTCAFKRRPSHGDGSRSMRTRTNHRRNDHAIFRRMFRATVREWGTVVLRRSRRVIRWFLCVGCNHVRRRRSRLGVALAPLGYEAIVSRRPVSRSASGWRLRPARMPRRNRVLACSEGIASSSRSSNHTILIRSSRFRLNTAQTVSSGSISPTTRSSRRRS